LMVIVSLLVITCLPRFWLENVGWDEKLVQESFPK
jgi:hypothetical protein